eukprot:TRINITY_DN2787_c0_g1_i5.p1 TRINITY_DN2787_c0_g1~~TRINITY_DN2787_c0_g1_i5.p1  ORF type:complete len:546 (-),score=33.85 TRINITY_DN2787_c0_g1_i5:77-1714(-)
MSSTDFVAFFNVAKKSQLTGPPYSFYGNNVFSLDIVLELTNSTDLIGSFGLYNNPFPDLTTKVTIDFLNTLARLNFSTVESYDTNVRDSVYCYTYAIRNLLQQGVHTDNIRGLVLMNALLNLDFEGVSGRMKFRPNGRRISGSYLFRNSFFANGSLTSKDTLMYSVGPNGSQLTVLEPATFVGGTTTQPDTTPQMPVNYFNCSSGRSEVDRRGLVVVDNRILLEPDMDCNGVFDCENLSDENSHCSPSLKSLEIALLAVTGVMILVILLVWMILVINWRSPILKRIGVIWITLFSLFSIVGLTAVFPFYGKLNPVKCAFQAWLSTMSSALLLCLMISRQFSWWRSIRNTGYQSRNTFTSRTKRQHSTEDFFESTINSTKSNPPQNLLRSPSEPKNPKKNLFFKLTSILISTIILVTNIILLSLLSWLEGGIVDNRCGSDRIKFWVLGLVLFNGSICVIGCLVSIIIQNRNIHFRLQRIVALSLFHDLFISAFLVTLYITLYDHQFESVIFSLLFIMLFFFDSFILITVPIIYKLLDTRLSQRISK